jgi:hypothetical protein
VARVVREFLDQVFVALAQLVLGQVGDGQLERREVLDKIAQHGVGETIFVGPLRVAEDTVELVGVGSLDRAHGGCSAAPTLVATVRTSSQWQSSGIWKR